MPTIHLENCTKCLKCVKDCPAHAIDIEAGTIARTCIHCGHCVAICPESTIEPDFGEISPLNGAIISADNFRDLTAGLRSIRYYLKKEVPEEIIEMLVENMRNYASASNARSIRITVVRTPEKIQLLNDMTLDAILKPMRLLLNPLVAPILKLFAPKINVSKLKEYEKSFIARRKVNSSIVCHHAPMMMLFHGPVARYGMLEADANIWATQTTVLAKTLGLGSCFIGFTVNAMKRSKKLREEMNIPAKHKVYAALALGYPKVNYQNQTSRPAPKVNYV